MPNSWQTSEGRHWSEFLKLVGALRQSKFARVPRIIEQKALQSPRSAYTYAFYVVGGEWPEGEPVIATEGKWSAEYAENVVEGRFEAGEPAIAESPAAASSYIETVLDFAEWPAGEEAIFAADDSNTHTYWKEHYRDSMSSRTPTFVDEWAKKQFGECSVCGGPLPERERDRYTNEWGDEHYCSRHCAERAYEHQHEWEMEYWTEEAMREAGVTDDKRIEEAQNFVKNYHKWLESPDAVKEALIDGDFLEDEDAD